MGNKKKPDTLGALRDSGYRSRTVKDEIRANLRGFLSRGEELFPGIMGYEKTVVPQLVNALLARHDIILLGLRGQAKTRILRMLTRFLDEYIPVLAGAPLNDDPFAPVSALGRRIILEQGEGAAVEWWHRDLRFGEKLATPDVSVADLLGDIDPVKAAREKLDFSDPEVVHYGIIPRSNRGIFAINELPDLQPRIQVGLLNILEEKDVQIRGFPVRIPLDLLMVFSANPEDYTNRGNIITPLKDRIDSQILTHYPTRLEDAMAITDQEAWTLRELAVEISPFIREVVEGLAFEARESEHVDQASGVSARVAIAALENVVSNAERRALAQGSSMAQARILDVVASLPAVTGKIELVYEGEQEGPLVVGMSLIGKAAKRVFDAHCPNPKAGKGEPLEDSPYADVLAHFNSGRHVDLSDADPDAEHRRKLLQVGGLEVLAKQCFDPQSAADTEAAMEIILEGLHQYNLLARESTDAAFRYTDMLATMLRGGDRE
jgi:magnesium chelatase subunit I